MTKATPVSHGINGEQQREANSPVYQTLTRPTAPACEPIPGLRRLRGSGQMAYKRRLNQERKLRFIKVGNVLCYDVAEYESIVRSECVVPFPQVQSANDGEADPRALMVYGRRGSR